MSLHCTELISSRQFCKISSSCGLRALALAGAAFEPVVFAAAAAGVVELFPVPRPPLLLPRPAAAETPPLRTALWLVFERDLARGGAEGVGLAGSLTTRDGLGG